MTCLVAGCGVPGLTPVDGRPERVRRLFQYSEHVFLNYETYGTGPRPVVLLHGFGASMDTWLDVKPMFAPDRFTLYLVDLKGFGFSSKPRDDRYTIAEQARIVVAFIERHGLHNATLVGQSYGGGVALLTAIHFQQTHAPGEAPRIGRLVLISPSAYVQELPLFIKALRSPAVGWSLSRMKPPKVCLDWAVGLGMRAVFTNDRAVTPERVRRHSLALASPGAFYSLAAAARQIVPGDPESIVSQYTQLNAPTLIIWGADDPVIPIECGHRLDQDLPDAHLAVIPDCGHVPQEERPQATFRLINEFLASTR